MEDLPFLEDIYPRDLLYASIIRSPVAKGRLKNIEVPELPDHFLIVTAKDIPGENKLFQANIPILAGDELSYIGEPVALLLGHDKIKLEDLALSCTVETEELTPQFDYLSSCETSVRRVVNIGDVQKPVTETETEEHLDDSSLKAFESTGKFVSGSYVTGIQEHWYAEPVGALTWLRLPSDINIKNKGEPSEESEKKRKTKKSKKLPTADQTNIAKECILIVRTATQWPYHVKNSVAKVLGIDPSTVVVEPTALNLHMDGKLWYPSLIACLAGLGTFITKRTVRLILNREEDFLFSPKRCAAKINIDSTVDEKGNITAADIDISVNLGSFAVNKDEIIDQICLGSLGLYDLKKVKLKAKGNLTNIPPQGAFSGFGLAQGCYAIERHISQVADMYKIDPAELRKNCIDTRLILPSLQSQTKNLISGQDLIDAATKMSDYYRKWASFELLRETHYITEKGETPRGIGIASGFQGNDLLHFGEDKELYSVELTLTKDGVLEINSSITSSEDYQRIWQKLASDVLSIQAGLVRIVKDDAPVDSGPSCSSRNISVITKLVEKCCQVIRKQRFHDPLPITVRRSVKTQNGYLRCDDWKVQDVSGFIKPSFAAAVVEVYIDLIECLPRIKGIWLAVDGGKIISKHRAKRSLSRSAIQALGWSFTENIEYVDGILPEKQYDNFRIFSPFDTPPIEIDFLSSDSNDAKGVGELPFTCVPAAFMQAVSQAMDHCYKTIPLKREDIWEIVRERNESVPTNINTQAVK